MTEEATIDKAREDSALFPMGLCLSGGGYRAAAFHLGALSYLDHHRLTDELTMLSTVSGGTFVGARYAISQVAGESFGEFFRSFYDFLEEVDLVKDGLDRLARGEVDVPSGRQDLIVSVAEIYAETFLARDDGTPWLFGDVLDALGEIPLQEVVFNSTEFRYGIDFRFQSSGRIGNGNVNIHRDVAKKLRLADITAMSSCFPGGFEPVGFPFDVHWPGGEVPEDVGDDFFHADGSPRPLPVMDGGIYDNQGLDALMKADKRAGRPLETVIISDVDQPDDDLYPYPELGEPKGITLDQGVALGWILAALSIVTFFATGAHLLRELFQGSWSLLGLAVNGTALLLSGATFLAFFALRRKVRNGLRRLPQAGEHAWKDLRRLKVEELVQMLYLRATSLLALTSSIFMKRIRGLVFRRYYSDERFRPKMVSNLIYKLTLERERKELAKIPGVEVPVDGSPLDRVARASVSMATTLWFVKARPWCLPSLVAAGQATLAYALLQNLYRRHRGVPSSGPAARLWEKLLADTQRFLEHPYWLLEATRPAEYRVPPAECSCADALAPEEVRS